MYGNTDIIYIHSAEPVNVSSSGIVNVTFANRISAALVDTVRSYASLKTAGVLIIGASLAVVAIGKSTYITSGAI